MCAKGKSPGNGCLPGQGVEDHPIESVSILARISPPRNLRGTPMPLVLTEQQFRDIVNASAALCPSDRDPFIAAVAAELHGLPIVGDGTVGRASTGKVLPSGAPRAAGAVGAGQAGL
jgi:hypothetical protein